MIGLRFKKSPDSAHHFLPVPSSLIIREDDAETVETHLPKMGVRQDIEGMTLLPLFSR